MQTIHAGFACSVASLSRCPNHYPPGHHSLRCAALVECPLGQREPLIFVSWKVVLHCNSEVPVPNGIVIQHGFGIENNFDDDKAQLMIAGQPHPLCRYFPAETFDHRREVFWVQFCENLAEADEE